MLRKLIDRLGPDLRPVSISFSSHHNEVRVVLGFNFNVLSKKGASCGWMLGSGIAPTIEEAIDKAEARLQHDKAVWESMPTLTPTVKPTASLDELEL